MNRTPFDPKAFREVSNGLCISDSISEDAAYAKLAKQAWDARAKAASEEVHALYKIEVLFGKNHHVNGELTYGMLTMWESGTKLHGGGDSLIYICPGKHLNRNTCEGVIPTALAGKGVIVCPQCLTAWPAKDLIGQVYFKLPIQKVAELVHKWFNTLGMNADIRIKYFYEDLRVAAEKEQEKQLMGDLLEVARSGAKRISRVYPLANIMKDVGAGADVYNRILAFVRM